MVVKKNKILTQKGGTPNVLLRYFDYVFDLLKEYNKLFELRLTSKNRSKMNDRIRELLEELQSDTCYKINLFKELSVILLKILNDNTINNELKMISSIRYIFNSLFSNMGENKNDFISKLLKIYRHILLIDFLYNKSYRSRNTVFAPERIFIKSLELLHLCTFKTPIFILRKNGLKDSSLIYYK